MSTRSAQTRKTSGKQTTRKAGKTTRSYRPPVSSTAPPPAHSLPQLMGRDHDAGEVLDGRWLLEKKLGEGGMGSVWAARNTNNGKEAAIKLMNPAYARVPYLRDTFVREGALSNAIEQGMRDHYPMPSGPGALDVYDTNTTPDGEVYLVMEKLEGGSPKKGMPAPEVAHILDEVLKTVEETHRKGIIHRDIKPDNVFVTKTGDVKLLDYGLAKFESEPDTFGSFTGTPGYAPPEQTIGMSEPRSDLYSVGAMGYALLTGKTPIPSHISDVQGGRYLSDISTGDVGRLAMGQARPDYRDFDGCPVPDVRTLAHVPPRLGAVITRAVACDPEDRYPNALAMRQDLEQAMMDVRSQSAPPAAEMSFFEPGMLVAASVAVVVVSFAIVEVLART